MTSIQTAFLLIWVVSAMISFGILGIALRDAANKTKEGESVNADGFFFMLVLSMLFGPLMTALLIGFVARGNGDKKQKGE